MRTEGLTKVRTWLTEDGEGVLHHVVYRHPRTGACIRVTTRV